MKKNIKYPIFILFLLFFIYGSELFYSILIQKDENLKNNCITTQEYNTLKKEYETLLEKNELLNIEEEKIVSKVILRDPLAFFETITILKGKEENVEVGDIISNEVGYIGQVKKVNSHSSEVELLTNKNTTLSVKINNSYGILQKESDKLIVKNITSKEEMKENDIVVTSNFSNIPGDIPIAKVTKITKTSIEQILEVTPIVDLENLNYVFIRKKINYD